MIMVLIGLVIAIKVFNSTDANPCRRVKLKKVSELAHGLHVDVTVLVQVCLD
jgi:predicted amidohydrolase